MLIELTATVGENDEITLRVPSELRGQEVKVRIEPAHPAEQQPDEVPWEERPWTKEEIEELLRPNPSTLGEIARSPEFGAWADLGIEDSQAWVDEVRRQEEERRKWPRD